MAFLEQREIYYFTFCVTTVLPLYKFWSILLLYRKRSIKAVTRIFYWFPGNLPLKLVAIDFLDQNPPSNTSRPQL